MHKLLWFHVLRLSSSSKLSLPFKKNKIKKIGFVLNIFCAIKKNTSENK